MIFNKKPVEILWRRGTTQRQVFRDLAVPHEVCQRGVHRLHPVLPTRLHDGIQLMRLALADKVSHCRRRYQHLAGSHPTFSAQARQELLSDDTFQRGGDLYADLLLLVRREYVDHPVDRLGAVLRVKGGEDQVSCLSRGERDLYGL